MADTIDLLQIKIERAKTQLSNETLNAINAVDWKAAILKLKEQKGFNFEQLGTLELETELVLCGLLNPRDYPKQLESEMNITKIQANELVNEMNKEVFSKIKTELIKSTERKNIFTKNSSIAGASELEPTENETSTVSPQEKTNAQAFSAHGIEIIPEKLVTVSTPTAPSILSQKLSGPVNVPPVKTEHSLQNLSSTTKDVPVKNNVLKTDPYREIPE